MSDIYVVDPAHPEDGDPRLAVIGAVDATFTTATIVLTTEVIEAATDRDLILTSSTTGLGFSLLLETDIAGPVLMSQLRAKVGSLDPATSELAFSMVSGVHDIASGALPIRSAKDPRWQFKAKEVEAIERLTQAAVAFLADGSSSTVVDPILLTTDWLSEQTATLILSALSNGDAALPLEATDAILGLSQPDARATSFALQVDFWNALRPYLNVTPETAPIVSPLKVSSCFPPRLDSFEHDPLMICVGARSMAGIGALRVLTDVTALKDLRLPKFWLVRMDDGTTVMAVPEQLASSNV